MALQIQPIDLVAPGFRGVNFEQQRSILPPHYATVAQNCYIDQNGLLTSRKGYSDITGTAIGSTPNVETLHEYIQEDGTREYIVAWDGGIGNDIDDPSGNDISGSVTDTSGTWRFGNGWDKVIGFQDGQKPIVYTGTGTFATVSEASGTAPTIADGVGLVAYGRVWGLDADKQIIKFSALQDETHWSTGAGQIDMASIWTNGTDQVTAIAAWGGALVVFGHRHIVFWVDGQGNQLGIDPDQLYVSDIVEGTGCESQWSLQLLGESDVLFLGSDGVHSLRRVLQSGGGAPVVNLSRLVRSQLLSDIQNTSSLSEIRSAIHQTDGLYILSFPTVGRTWVFHYNRPYRDDATQDIQLPITTWDLAPTAWLWDEANARLLLGFAGNVGLYGGAVADNGTNFNLEYQSSWLNLGEQVANRLKILKRIGSIIFVTAASAVTYKWDFDFKGQFSSKTVNYSAASVAEWGTAEFNSSEYSGGLSLRIFKFPARGRGQYMKVGVTVEVTSTFSIQQLELFSKLGVYA